LSLGTIDHNVVNHLSFVGPTYCATFDSSIRHDDETENIERNL
jgi:hypothetical protein